MNIICPGCCNMPCTCDDAPSAPNPLGRFFDWLLGPPKREPAVERLDASLVKYWYHLHQNDPIYVYASYPNTRTGGELYCFAGHGNYGWGYESYKSAEAAANFVDSKPEGGAD